MLWLNSISTRAPQLGSSSDIGKLVRKLRDSAKGPVEVEPNLFVYTPIVLPFPHLRVAAGINRDILRLTLAVLRRKLKMNRYQLWTFIPTALPYMGMPGEDLSVYYCTDAWSSFTQVDGERIGPMEWEMCRRADVVFATAQPLLDRRLEYNSETHLALHGVDHQHFAEALDERRPFPTTSPIARGPSSASSASFTTGSTSRCSPTWPSSGPIGPLPSSARPASTSRRWSGCRTSSSWDSQPYDELPRYCKAFSVGVMPFALNELTTQRQPDQDARVPERGLPVVSTDLPEVRGCSESVRVARSPDDFVRACEEAIAADDPGCADAAATRWPSRPGTRRWREWDGSCARQRDAQRGVASDGVERRSTAEAWCDPHRRRRAAELHEGGARSCRLHARRRRPRARPHRTALRRQRCRRSSSRTWACRGR